ncbi:MAG: DegT/DnrJ/EryC1/StrS family aminotransferase [Pseudomonadota bacterium]
MSLLPLAKPFLGDREIAAQARVLQSGRLVLGPENLAFEDALANLVGRPQAIAVASGTAALHLVLWALDLPPGSEVIVPAFTFPAPANAAEALGLKAVAADVDPATWNISPARVAALVNKKTSAIIAVDQFGIPADHAGLESLAVQAGVALVEDAACAIGAAGQLGRLAGSFGVAACFSFHPRKVVTTGEGGAIMVSDVQLARRIRALRNHGQQQPGEFSEVGLNYRMPEVAAAIGRVQLSRLPVFLEERRRLVSAYRACLSGTRLGGGVVRVQEPPPEVSPTWQTFALLLPPSVDRSRVVTTLRERGVEAGPATYALHRLGTFAGRPGFTASVLPVANELHDSALALPLWNGMTEADVTRVVEALEGSF